MVITENTRDGTFLIDYIGIFGKLPNQFVTEDLTQTFWIKEPDYKSVL